MSRLYFTNNGAWSNKLDTSNKLTGLQLSYKATYCEMYVSSFKKLKVNNDNCYVSGNDFVISAGTLFYKSLFGKDALCKILEDSKTSSVSELRQYMYGSYALAIKIGDFVRIFVDETNTFKLYYHSENNNYVITNSYFQIGECLDIELNEYVLVENFTRGLLGHQTPIKDVVLLGVKEYIEISISKNVFSILSCDLNDYSREFSSKDNFVIALLEEIEKISLLKGKYIHNSMLFLTGGIDSRLQLAADLQSGSKPVIAYWNGTDVITNGTRQDSEIAEELAKKNNLMFKLYDVSESFQDALSSIKTRKNKYGEYSSLYAGNSKWYQIFESIDDIEGIEFGYSGELLRELSALDNSYKAPYTLDEFIDKVIDRAGIGKTLFSLSNFRRFLSDDIKSYSNWLSFNNLSKKDAFLLFSCTRFAGDTTTINFSNLFVYSFPMFFQKQIVDMIFSVPYEWLSDSNISVRLIENINSSLLNTKLYSHHRDYVYDAKNHCIKESIYFRLLDYLKPRLVNTKLYSAIYTKHAHKYIRPQSIDNELIMEQCIKFLKSSTLFNSTSIELNIPENWKSVDVATLAVNVANLYSLDIQNNRGN